MSSTRSHSTRALHLSLLVIVVSQLLTSQVMERPFPGEEPGWPFLLHEWIGLAAYRLTGKTDSLFPAP